MFISLERLAGKIRLFFCAEHANQWNIIPHVLWILSQNLPSGALIFLSEKVYDHIFIKKENSHIWETRIFLFISLSSG